MADDRQPIEIAPDSRSSRFDSAYEGRPPWDIGRPQPEVLRLADDGEFRGEVLDLGCGTGEHALELARRGLSVLGIDGSANAVRRARTKAAERGLAVEFRISDALHLDRLGRRFDSILDCGLFHVFDDAERSEYVRSLEGALRSGGRYFLLCFSDSESAGIGPRRVSEAEIRGSFQTGWTIDVLRPCQFETNLPGFTARAWSGRLTHSDG